MTRALWVTAEAPDRRGGGGNIRQAHLLEALARQVDTTLVLLGRLEDEGVRAAVGSVTEVPRPRSRGRAPSRVDVLLRALRPAPWDVSDAALERAALAAGWPDPSVFDLVCVQHLGLAGLIPRPHANRWILHLFHVSSAQAGHAAAIGAGRRQRWLWRREADKARRYEQWVAGAYDQVVTVSEADAAALPGAPAVVPNGVDADHFHPTPLPRSGRLVFTGRLDYFPNIEGLVWFCREVLPLVRRQHPDVAFDIVGRSPVPEVLELADGARVTVHADVPDVMPYLEAARVAVVPLRIGTGTRLKALEAMAAGRPVVGTTIGMEGLAIEPGVHAVVADESAGMADAICRLIGDEALANRVTGEARALVEARYRWDRIGEQFAGLLEAAVLRAHAGTRR